MRKPLLFFVLTFILLASTLAYVYAQSQSSVDTYAVFWVKVPSIPASPDTATIYIYYGNSTVSTTSNKKNTFVLADDFSADTLDSDLWVLNDPDYVYWGSYDDAVLDTANDRISFTEGVGSDAGGNIRAVPTTPDEGFHAKFRIEITNNADGIAFHFYANGNKGESGYYDMRIWFDHYNDRIRLSKLTDGTFTTLATVSRTNPQGVMDVYVTSDRVKVYDDGELVLDWSGTVQKTETEMCWGGGNGGQAGDHYLYEVYYVRKYVDPEPSHGSWGSEETSGSNWLSGWSYRKSHEIQGSTAGAVSDYQIKIVVHRKDGTDSGMHVYVGDKCQSDFDDIRFTDANGNELDYWLEEKVTVRKDWGNILQAPLISTESQERIGGISSPLLSTESQERVGSILGYYLKVDGEIVNAVPPIPQPSILFGVFIQTLTGTCNPTFSFTNIRYDNGSLVDSGYAYVLAGGVEIGSAPVSGGAATVQTTFVLHGSDSLTVKVDDGSGNIVTGELPYSIAISGLQFSSTSYTFYEDQEATVTLLFTNNAQVNGSAIPIENVKVVTQIENYLYREDMFSVVDSGYNQLEINLGTLNFVPVGGPYILTSKIYQLGSEYLLGEASTQITVLESQAGTPAEGGGGGGGGEPEQPPELPPEPHPFYIQVESLIVDVAPGKTVDTALTVKYPTDINDFDLVTCEFTGEVSSWITLKTILPIRVHVVQKEGGTDQVQIPIQIKIPKDTIPKIYKANVYIEARNMLGETYGASNKIQINVGLPLPTFNPTLLWLLAALILTALIIPIIKRT